MPGEGQLRYDAELKFRPDYWKYRRAPPPESKYRSLFYKNDWDGFSKVMSGLSVGTISGVGLWSVAACYAQKPTIIAHFYPKALAEAFIKVCPQPMAAGVTYGAAVSLATNFRNKEDALNHFIGGVLAASLYTNFYTKNWRVKTCLGLIGGVFCASIKYSKETFGPALLWTVDLRPAGASFSDYRHSWFSSERKNLEGADDAKQDTRFFNGTVNSRYRGNLEQ